MTSDQLVRRTRMVGEQIEARGIRSKDVLDAMRSVPRHLFVPGDLETKAYVDSPLAIGYGQTISQPYMVALMTELLDVNVRSRVLEIGSGSGYQTAVLGELAGEVYAIERLAPLSERARGVLTTLAYDNVHVAIGDGTLGWPEEAPFDGVLVAAAVEKVPPALLEQLAEGGRLVIPIGDPGADQSLTLFQRRGDRFVRRSIVACRFVPLRSGSAARGELNTPARLGVDTTSFAPGRSCDEEDAMKSVDVRVLGKVHGVFYRASAREEAARLGLLGWVRNVDDGSVALRLQGDPSVVDAMLAWCSVGPPAARVDRVEVSDATPDEGLSGFEVRR